MPFDAKRYILALLARGWHWSEFEDDVLLHPRDERFALRYDRANDTLQISPDLNQELTLVILTPSSKSPSHWRS